MPVHQTAEFQAYFAASLDYEGDVRASGHLTLRTGFEPLASVFVLAMAEGSNQLKVIVDEDDTIDVICEVFLHAVVRDRTGLLALYANKQIFTNLAEFMAERQGCLAGEILRRLGRLN